MNALSSDARGLIVPCPKCAQNNRWPYERLDRVPHCAKCGALLDWPGQPVEVDDEAAFAALVERSILPVLVDFWAAWCGPCKTIAPEIAKVAAHGAGKWVAAKVNTEMLPGPARRYAVTSIPLLVILHQGREVSRQAGAMPAPAIQQWLERHI